MCRSFWLVTWKTWLFTKHAKQLANYHADIQKTISGGFPKVKGKLKCDMEAAALLAEAEMQDLYKYIDCLPDGNILCHFDFHPNNIILSDNNYSIIDWMTACKGDRLNNIEYFDLQAKIFAVLNEYKTSNFRYNQIKGSTFLDTTP